jgi:CheY-like chemotaxis protein
VRLEFNVLWVEDQPERVEAQRVRIERVIRKEGFKLDVIFAPSVQEARKYLSDDIYGDHIDLILMDYDLEGDMKGDEGLVEVRQIFPYKDVVFYSANAPDLLKKVQERGLQGVFCSIRDDLPQTVEGLFEALVKKVIDIDHSRGIVMGATSDIDYYVNEALITLFGAAQHDEREMVLGLVAERMKEIRGRFELAAGEVEAVKTVADLLDKHHIYTSGDRIQLLRKVLGARSLKPGESKKMGAYAADVAPRRNDLAHVRVEKHGFSRKLFDRKGKEFTSEEMKALRLTLLEHREMFEALADSLAQGPA